MNKTNSKLLYADLLKTAANEQTDQSDSQEANQDDYSLLNTFEMLWNIDGAAHLQKPQEK